MALAAPWGWSHLAPEVSTGLASRYSASQASWQSHTNGLAPRCLKGVAGGEAGREAGGGAGGEAGGEVGGEAGGEAGGEVVDD